MAQRVQIPAYTDRWMMGDRYGEVVKVTERPKVKGSWFSGVVEIAHVKLDKSGKTIKVLYDDCTVVS